MRHHEPHRPARVQPAPDNAARALAAAAAWCTATHATEHRARPSIVSVCNALEAAKAAPSRGTFDVLARALVVWCEAASARANGTDLAPAMLAAVRAAGDLDAVRFDAG